MTIERKIHEYLREMGSASRAEILRDLQCNMNTLNAILSRLIREGYVQRCKKSRKRGDSIKPRLVFHFSCGEKSFDPINERTIREDRRMPLAKVVRERHAREATEVPRELIHAFSRMVAA